MERLKNTFRLRSVIFAWVFGPPRLVGREEAMQIYDAICKSLRVDDLSFTYETGGEPSQGGFAVKLQRKEGRGGLQVLFDGGGQANALRLLIEHAFPRGVTECKEEFDLIHKGFWEGWTKVTKGTPPSQIVLGEVRLRGQCASGRDSAASILTRSVLRFGDEAVRGLRGAIDFASLKLEIPNAETSLDGLGPAKREIQIEPLRAEPADFYVEVMSQWKFLHAIEEGVLAPLTVPELEGKTPSILIEDGFKFTRDNVLSLVPEPESK